MDSVLDRFEVIAYRAKYPVAIFISTDGSAIELVDLDGPVTETDSATLIERGLHFAGAIGILDGVSEIETVSQLPVDIAFVVGAAYSRHLLSKSHGVPSDSDSLPFLKALWALHDPRSEA